MKQTFLTALLIIISYALFADGFQADVILNSTSFRSGIGIGTIIAIVASWTRNKSILWAILHAFLGWIYVIYYLFTR